MNRVRRFTWTCLVVVMSVSIAFSADAYAKDSGPKTVSVSRADGGKRASDGAAAAKAASQPTSAPASLRVAKVAPEAKRKVEASAAKVRLFLSTTGRKHVKVKHEKALNKGLGKPPKGLDRSSPKTSWSSFLRQCKAQRWGVATHVFNLGDIPFKDQQTLGASRAKKLCEVLEVTKQTSVAGLPDSTIGPIVADTPSNYVVVARVQGREGIEEAWLRRTHDDATKQDVWVLTRRSLANVGTWHSRLVQGIKGRAAVAVINVGLGPLPKTMKLGSPRAAATTFDTLIRRGDYAEASRLLDLRRIKKDKQKNAGEKLVRRLSFVLTRLKPGFAASLSNDPPGAPERGVPDDEEQILTTKVTGQGIPVRLAYVCRQNADPVWIFSGGTVAAINKLYNQYGPGWAGDYLPPMFFSVHFAKVQLWQWIGLILGLILAFIFGRVAAFFSRKGLLRAARLTSWEWDDKLVEATRGPLTTLLASLGFIIVLGFLALAEGPEKITFGIVKVVVILASGWFLTRVLDVAAAVALEFFQGRSDEVGMAMVPVARKIIKPIVYLLILIVALQNVGVNVAGLLAGLGIGGLALAMASKSTLENMLGGITIAFDRPFKVGDFVRVGDLLGSVEEVGLRSTRVRTLDRTVVTVPNGQMADSKVENYAHRDRIRLVFKIGVQYDSSLDQVKLIVDNIKRTVLRHPKIINDGFRVRFVGFGDSALMIEIYVYADTTDYNEFTAIREKLFLEIAEIVTNAGAQFAFPSQTIYQGKAADADSDKARLAADEVQKRIAAGEFTIPEIPDELREKLTVDVAADSDLDDGTV
ncbi:MAG: mechanosensitive ion channel family protein [Deltaproteobacteria bacterium]|nr:mechanosensitive ion channel family protein [Deltaproteobacteria bacterium]